MPTNYSYHSSNFIDPQANRLATDRRRSYFRSLLYSLFKRRRKLNRRKEDPVDNTFVDIHEPKLAFIFWFTLSLCMLDAVLTLFIIENGGEEINPFMAFLMNKDVSLFFWVKALITTFGLLFLILHKNFIFYRMLSGYHILYGIASMYLVLVSYEIILITQVIPRSL